MHTQLQISTYCTSQHQSRGLFLCQQQSAITNHTHLLVMSTTPDDSVRLVQVIGRHYVQYINRMHHA